MKVAGLDKLQRNLEKISKDVAALDGQHDIPVTDFLTPTFISEHTNFLSADELFAQSGFKIESAEDFSAIPDEDWDQYIRSVSSFSNWQEMLSKAAEVWALAKINGLEIE